MQFIEQANKHHPTIKLMAEISETETIFLDTNIYKGERFKSNSVFDKHCKSTETFQYTHFSSCHPPGVRKGFIKREALTLLRTNSSLFLTIIYCNLYLSHPLLSFIPSQGEVDTRMRCCRNLTL